MLNSPLQIAAATIVAVAMLPTASAQTPARLANDDPIVIEQLIALYDGLSSHIRTRDAEDPANAASRRDGAMRIFGLSPAGYEALGTVLSAAKIRLDGVRIARSRYLSGAAGAGPPVAPDSAQMQALYQQELSVFQSVPVDLKSRLGPADWANLQAFITSELASKIQVAPLTRPRPAPVERRGESKP